MDVFLTPGTYDFFLVGGGSGSSYDFNDYNNSSSSTGTSGGGGGYTTNILKYDVSSEYKIPVTVGGASVGSDKLVEGSELPRETFKGNPTTVSLADKTYTANGGTVLNGGKVPSADRMAYYAYDGGSGGGRVSSPGGKNGSNGGGASPGIGQHTTTQAFGDLQGTSYAGGGGGHNAQGGAGGGGNGISGTTGGRGVAGTPNTGGGGGGSYRRSGGMAPVAAGGSGIVIVRWNN